MIRRRSLLAAAMSLIAPALPALAAALIPPAASAQTKKVTVVFMTADNCPPCKVWEKNVEPTWRKTRQFELVEFKLIASLDIRDLRQSSSWYVGRELLPIYQAFLADEKRWTAIDADSQYAHSGAPRWFIVVDGTLVYQSVKWSRISTKLDEILNLSSF